MDRSHYEIIKKKYGEVASWLIYDEEYGNYEKNYDLIEKSFDILKPNYIFCGLNAARDTLRTWEAFHCKYRGGKGKLLKDTFNNSKVFKGAYVTDLIKKHVNAKSNKVVENIRSDNSILRENIDMFYQEISDLKGVKTKPIIFAFGLYTHELLHECSLGRDFNIEYIPHYAAYGHGSGKFVRRIRELERTILNGV